MKRGFDKNGSRERRNKKRATFLVFHKITRLLIPVCRFQHANFKSHQRLIISWLVMVNPGPQLGGNYAAAGVASERVERRLTPFYFEAKLVLHARKEKDHSNENIIYKEIHCFYLYIT